MYVSVSVYDDAPIAAGCLESIYREIDNPQIALVDGRYSTWPAPNDNSEPFEAMQSLADAYNAEYYRDGPFPKEVNKHRHRVELAPDGELVLFMDADERLARFDASALSDEIAYDTRIFNPIVYGPRTTYWPRVFDPAVVDDVIRWDKYVFHAPRERTDAVTIVHRHDLRKTAYREAKYERFDTEGRKGIYAQVDRGEEYLNGEIGEDISFEDCPVCGNRSAIASTPSKPQDEMSIVVACMACDEHAVLPYEIGEWQYLPELPEAAWDDPERLQAELTDAGCPFMSGTSIMTMHDMKTAIEMWVDEVLRESGAGIFAEAEEPEEFADAS